MDFRKTFEYLAGYPPYHWQETKFEELASGVIASVIDKPTGSGKTSIISIWLLARAVNPKLPRRLVYVVDRRSVVDQSTTIVEKIAAKLTDIPINSPIADVIKSLPDGLGISTLRGEFEDNEEWSMFPHRPSVIVGTVDMIGSRLLFSGYGDGAYTRALHAGLLGNDAWIVFDECHLVPAFMTLLRNVAKAGGKLKDFHVTTMSATGEMGDDALSEEDLSNSTFRQRFTAKKKLQIVTSQSVEKSILSLAKTGSEKRTIIFLESPSTVTKIAQLLPGHVVCLTGTMRGKERDELVNDPVLHAFTARQEPSDQHFLVATSAGEVGIDLTCSKLITDAASAQSLVQRFGRCNRFGECETTHIYVVAGDSKKDERFTKDLEFIRNFNEDASCANLWEHRGELSELAHIPPMIPTLEPCILDELSMTSLLHDVDVDEYLRGKERENKYVEIAFRTEAALIAQLNEGDIEYYFRHFPLLGFERLSEKESRVKELILAAKQDAQGTLITATGDARSVTFADLLPKRVRLTNCTLILPAEGSGLGLHGGMLCNSDSPGSLDVSTIAHQHHPARTRLILDKETEYQPLKNEKVVFDRIVGDKRIVIVKQKQSKRRATELLRVHQTEVAKYAEEFAIKVGLDPELVSAITEAAKHHDIGKANPIWQLAARGGSITSPVAKTSHVNSAKLNGFRHEFEIDSLNNELTLHLIGAHHGGARPTWIGTRPLSPVNRDGNRVHTQINRFASLQRRFGAWGLAYLEAILRCADAYASDEF